MPDAVNGIRQGVWISTQINVMICRFYAQVLYQPLESGLEEVEALSAASQAFDVFSLVAMKSCFMTGRWKP